MTPESECLRVCIWAHSTSDIHERFPSHGRHKCGTMVSLSVMEESQDCWQTDKSKGSLSSGLGGIRTRKMENRES